MDYCGDKWSLDFFIMPSSKCGLNLRCRVLMKGGVGGCVQIE